MRASYILIIANDRVKVKEKSQIRVIFIAISEDCFKAVLNFCDKSVKLKY